MERVEARGREHITMHGSLPLPEMLGRDESAGQYFHVEDISTLSFVRISSLNFR
jgi:hypothetical protein